MLPDLARLCADRIAADALPSLSIAVGQDGEVAYAETFRPASATATVPDDATPYLLASVTKPILATAVTVLHQQGRLDLDEPLTDRLGGLPLPVPAAVGAAAPTVRHALTHTAGLGTHYDFYYADEPQRRPEAAETFARYATLFRAPGQVFEYSNLGYAALDEVIRTVTGQDPAAFVVDEVFAPLGATSGWLGAAYHGSAAPAPRWAEDGSQYPDYDTTHRGASMAWLTASDLVRFGLAHAGGPTVLDDASLRLAHTPSGVPRPDLEDGEGYAFGWTVYRRGAAGDLLTHGGGMGGVSTALAVLPDRHLAVAVLCNVTGGAEAVTAVRDHVLATLVPDLRPPQPPASPDPAAGPPVHPGRWTGHVVTYAGDVPLTLDVDDAGAVTADLGDARGVTAEVVPTGLGDAYAMNLTVPERLPTPDARHNCPVTRLSLNPADDGAVLHGAVRAAKTGEAGGRVGNCRGHWCELRRV